MWKCDYDWANNVIKIRISLCYIAIWVLSHLNECYFCVCVSEKYFIGNVNNNKKEKKNEKFFVLKYEGIGRNTKNMKKITNILNNCMVFEKKG